MKKRILFNLDVTTPTGEKLKLPQHAFTLASAKNLAQCEAAEILGNLFPSNEFKVESETK